MHLGSSILKNVLSGGAKALVSVVVLVLIFSPLSQVFSTPIVRADVPTASTEASYGPSYTPTAATIPGTTAPTTTTDPTGTGGGVNCGVLSGWSICVSNIVYVFTVSLGTGVAYIGATLFNVAVKFSLTSASYSLDFITSGWTVVRDIANMFFILILIYIAMTIILSADTGHTMQLLAAVIFIALIINFSFFLTRLAIDAGNIAALEFYNNISAPAMSQASDSSVAGGAVVAASGIVSSQIANTKDLTYGIMNAVQVQNILNTPSFQKFYQDNGFLSNVIALSFIYISVGAILFILAAAFLTAGIKFLMRMIVLWFMIIVSPLALVARTMHQFEHHYDKWQDTLIKHVFYPAVFLFIFWVLTKMTAALAGNNPSIIAATFNDINGMCSTASTGVLACIGTIIAVVGIRLGFVIVMLFIGLKAADEMGIMGAKAAHGITAKLPGFGGLAAYSGGVYRNTVGRASARADSSLKTGWAGQLLNRVPGGYAVGDWARQRTVSPLKNTSIGGTDSRQEVLEHREKAAKERKFDKRVIENLPAIKELQALDNENAATPLTDPIKIKRRADLQDRINNLSSAEVGAIGEGNLKAYANLFSENVIKKIMDSDKVSDSGKQAIRDKYNREGKDAAITKANKQIDLLREIRDDLSRPGTGGVAFNPTDHLNLINIMDNAGGKTVDSKVVQKALTETRKELAKQQQLARTTGSVKAEENALQLREIVTKLNKLDDERGKVPVGVGGEVEAGKFKTKAP